MRIRSIRPEFWTSEDVARMDWTTRLVYIGLWSYVDDNGVGRDLEPLIVAALFPLDDDQVGAAARVRDALAYLTDAGQISRYRVDGKPYLHVTAWSTHQKINRPTPGRYPLPTSDNTPAHDTLTEQDVSPQEDSLPGEGEKGRRGEGEKAAPKRATQLPAGWTCTDEHAARARELGLDLNTEIMKFRAYSDEKGRTAKNWNAAFTRWLINAAEYAKRDGRAPARPVGAAVRRTPNGVTLDQFA